LIVDGKRKELDKKPIAITTQQIACNGKIYASMTDLDHQLFLDYICSRFAVADLYLNSYEEFVKIATSWLNKVNMVVSEHSLGSYRVSNWQFKGQHYVLDKKWRENILKKLTVSITTVEHRIAVN
jgi:hypothetical protein